MTLRSIGKIIVELIIDGLNYLWRRLLIGIAVVAVGVAVSFIITKQFTFTAFSERLVWVGIALIMMAGFIMMAQMYAGKEFGVGSMVRSVSEARRLMDHNLEIRTKMEKRYDVALLVWLVGMGTIGVAAIVEIVFA